MWDLRSPTGSPTHVPSIGRQILNHWTTREVPIFLFICLTASGLSCGIWDLVSWPEPTLGSLHWEQRGVATGPPGKSPALPLYRSVVWVGFFINLKFLWQALWQCLPHGFALNIKWEVLKKYLAQYLIHNKHLINVSCHYRSMLRNFSAKETKAYLHKVHTGDKVLSWEPNPENPCTFYWTIIPLSRPPSGPLFSCLSSDEWDQIVFTSPSSAQVLGV